MQSKASKIELNLPHGTETKLEMLKTVSSCQMPHLVSGINSLLHSDSLFTIIMYKLLFVNVVVTEYDVM